MLCTLLLYTASIAVTLVQLPLSSGCTKRTKKPPAITSGFLLCPANTLLIMRM